ncbi:putative monooxygenase [Whalleya microplaca]|nr:putative monooxygenase [Whalleya microplaca]
MTVNRNGFQLQLFVGGQGLQSLPQPLARSWKAICARLQVPPTLLGYSIPERGFDKLRPKAAVPYLAVRRYDGTCVLAYEDHFQKKILERPGTPFWYIQRAGLQTVLVLRTESLSVDSRLGADVIRINFQRVAVTTRDGQTSLTQLNTDGLCSRTRSLLVPAHSQVIPKLTGDLTSRIILDLTDIQDQELKRLVSNPSVNFWIGPEHHVAEDIDRAAANVDKLRKLFELWDPTSDACHPTLPNLAQGANSPLEDGAVIGRLLKYVTSQNEQSIIKETLGHVGVDWTCPSVQSCLYGYDAAMEADKAYQAHLF